MFHSKSHELTEPPSYFLVKILLNECELFGDVTCSSYCRQFDQLYTIHADIGSTQSSTNVIHVALLLHYQEVTYTISPCKK